MSQSSSTGEAEWRDFFCLDSDLQESLRNMVLGTVKEIHTLKCGQTHVMALQLEDDCSRTVIETYILELLNEYFHPTFIFHMMHNGNISISRNENLIQGLTREEFNTLACLEPPLE